MHTTGYSENIESANGTGNVVQYSTGTYCKYCLFLSIKKIWRGEKGYSEPPDHAGHFELEGVFFSRIQQKSEKHVFKSSLKKQSFKAGDFNILKTA
jgi:hypothetical protein